MSATGGMLILAKDEKVKCSYLDYMLTVRSVGQFQAFCEWKDDKGIEHSGLFNLRDLERA